MRSSWYLNDIISGEGETTISGSGLNRNPIIVLASASKNRLRLLQQIGVNPIVEPSNYKEDLPKSLPPPEYVKKTAKLKALEVAERFRESNTSFDVIIGADTMISFDGIILGKPHDKDDAFETLKRLNGETHSVYTGVAIIDAKSNEIENFHTETVVEFGRIPDGVLRAYVNGGEPIGCAGSYAIQGQAGAFVKSITGCYHNIVGLPIYEVVKRLRYILKK